MMCILFHKWPKWSKLKEERWKHIVEAAVNEIKEIKYVRRSQERVCEKCGKHDKRYIGIGGED